MGPKSQSASSFILMFYDLQRKITSCWDGTLPQKVRHQNTRLDRVLSHSGQHCVDLSPIKNYNFGWGPNFIESIFFGSGFLRLATEAYMPFGFARCLARTLGSSQDCVDLSPMENYNFAWGSKICPVTIFFASDVLRLARENCILFQSCASCLARTLVSIRFFLTQVRAV